MPVQEPKAISELKGIKLYFLSMKLSEKYIVAEKCQGWQNLGMPAKLKEKCRCENATVGRADTRSSRWYI